MGDVLEDVEVSLEPPSDNEGREDISAYLFALRRAPALQGRQRAPLLLHLSYLVTASHGEPAVAHDHIGRLVVAALEHADFVADVEPIASDWWRSFGVLPRPAFVLRVPWRVDRPERRGPPVTEQIEISTSPMRFLRGVVVGPEQTPVVAAVVRVPQLGKRVTTDSAGKFVLEAVPADGGTLTLEVHARGRTQRVELQLDEVGGEVEIHMEQLCNAEE